MKFLLENWREYLKEEKISVKDIHDRADKLGIPWDDDDKFMRWTKKITDKSHLDDLTDEELSKVYAALEKREFLNEEEELYGELYHGTSDLYKQDILENGIRAPSYWGTEEIAWYYAKVVAEEYGGRPLIIKIPLSKFDQSLLKPDHNSIAEPLTRTLGKSDEEVWEEWEEVPEPGTWQDSLDIVQSVEYHGPVKVLEEDLQ